MERSTLTTIMEIISEWSGFFSGCVNVTTVLCTLVAAFYLIFYFGWVAGKPKVFGGDARKNQLNLKELLLKHCPILSQTYWPTFWAFQCHLTTILRFILQKDLKMRYKRDILTLSDGGEVALDWGRSDLPRKEDVPVLLIIPGISGSSRSKYIQFMVLNGLKEGYRPVVFNQRGTGGIKLKTIHTYSAADISDLFEVTHYIHMHYPQADVVGIGFSLGGMILTQYLHQLGKKCDLRAAITVSTVWDPFATRESLEGRIDNRLIYSRLMTNELKEMIVSNTSHFTAEERKKLPVNLDEIMKATVVSHIDIHLTVPLFGYACLDDYYTASRNADKIHKISTPLVCVTAADDPFVPKDSIPFKEFESNPYTTLILTPCGGHMGFIDSIYPNGETWLDRLLKQVLATLKHSSVARSISDH